MYSCDQNKGHRQNLKGRQQTTFLSTRKNGGAPNSSFCSSCFCSSSLCGSDFRNLRRGLFRSWKELQRRQDTKALCQAGGLRHSDWTQRRQDTNARGQAGRQRHSDWLQEKTHGGESPRKDHAKKNCTGAHGQAEELGLKQGNHDLRRRNMKSRANGPAPSLCGHTTQVEKCEQWHRSPAPRKQAANVLAERTRSK